MPVTTNANDLSIVHRGSGGIASATLPDVCKTPSAAGGTPVPVPYPNIAFSMDLVGGTTTVMVDGQMAAIQGSKFVKSTGDEPGVAGGVVSGVFIMEATFISFSPTVSMDGKPVCRLTDKMLMNKANTVCLGGVMQQPVPPEMCMLPTPAPPEEPKFCVFKNLKVKCGHKSRNFRVDAHKYTGATLQVIADPSGETLEFEFEDRCEFLQQSPGCGRVHVWDEHGKEMKLEGKKVTLPLPPDQSRWIPDWWTMFRKLGPSLELRQQTYTVFGTTCDGSGIAEVQAGEYMLVEVFPNAGWSGELEFSYAIEKKQKKVFIPTEGRRESERRVADKDLLTDWEGGKFTLTGTITATLGRTNLSPTMTLTSPANKKPKEAGEDDKKKDPAAAAENEKKDSAGDAKKPASPEALFPFKNTLAAINSIAKVIDSLQRWTMGKGAAAAVAAPGVGALASTTVKPRWPKIKLGGGVALVEVEEKSIVRAEGNWFIEASPLIGLEVNMDIFDWLVTVGVSLCTGGTAMPFVNYLLRVKGRLKEGMTVDGWEQTKDNAANVAVDFGVKLTIGGSIGGGLGWKYTDKIEVDSDKAQITGKIDFKCDALIKVEAKLWIVKAEGYAAVSALSKSGGGPSILEGRIFAKEPEPGEKRFAWGGSLSFNGLAIWYTYYLDVGAESETAIKQPPKGKSGAKVMGKGTFGGGKAIDERGLLCTLFEPWTLPKAQEKSIVEAM